MNSYWIDSVPHLIENVSSLNQDISCDVCIVGGGLTGLTCAYLLSKSGYKIALLDKDSLAYKTSGNTTAKITSQHNLFYHYLANSFSMDFAKTYLEANQQAINNINSIITSENIDCDFEIQDNYVYTNSDSFVSTIKDELDIVNSLGFPAKLVDNTSLRIKMLSAICFPNQAQFHPRKYMAGLCKCILDRNGEIFENSKVIDIKKNNDFYDVCTQNHTVSAKYVIMATRYPIINFPGFYFLKMYQSLSYVIAIQTKQPLFDGMYINAETPNLSFKTVPYKDKRLVLVGGLDHKLGTPCSEEKPYEYLTSIAKGMYSDASVLFNWETQDCISLDKLPYIGEFSHLMPNVFVATGFKKWGMTFSNIAANIICDFILKRNNPYSNTFLSTRFHPVKNSAEVGNMVKELTQSFVIDKLTFPKESLKDINLEEGKIISFENKKVGIYRDKFGKFHAVSPICTHLRL